MGEYDEADIYGTLTPQEAAKLGIVLSEQMPIVYGEDATGTGTQFSETADSKGRKLRLDLTD